MKYKLGDKVKIINYGALIWHNRGGGNVEVEDIMPKIIGKAGVISESHLTQGIPTYAVDGIPEKHAWYFEDQLEMISPNPNSLDD